MKMKKLFCVACMIFAFTIFATGCGAGTKGNANTNATQTQATLYSPGQFGENNLPQSSDSKIASGEISLYSPGKFGENVFSHSSDKTSGKVTLYSPGMFGKMGTSDLMKQNI